MCLKFGKKAGKVTEKARKKSEKMTEKARKKSEKMTEKARKKSEKMADEAKKQSDKIADKLEEPIEALKGLVVITKLDAVGEDAAEHLKEVNDRGGLICIKLSIF